METISVSELKAHLSEELKKVQKGRALTILDHKRPVATLSAYKAELFVIREALIRYAPGKLAPLVSSDTDVALEREREESW